MSLKEIISNKNNWFIAEIIEKLEPVNRDETNDLRRVTTWGNNVIIKANSLEEAYDKAVKIGKEGEYIFTNTDKVEMQWIFVGVGDLLPIYEDIEDGAEIMWTDYGFISNRRTMRMAYEKSELLELRKTPKDKK
ncbi:protein of unknown function [Algoriella xinjiangensis]|uniref:DUF4288 domain-containing protein n=1 Tax=Algoriella xinjiangensis TaxID=684065 RepID=A0A1I5B0K3_9FLAO|nr:DUF4288 domain-containing protein [Algoriella xinjiangensis]SFN68234.1 protein of unknown function [Algoriella xinjiangensis]VDH16935.1 Uncharacterised protein [Algoriella xinjiangensis]